MELDRRAFLKLCGMAAGAIVVPAASVLAAPPDGPCDSNGMGMLSDLTCCVGCGWCQDACREWNELATSSAEGASAKPAGDCLSADTWTMAQAAEVEIEGEVHRVFAKRQCMHCVNPACVSACPVGALQKLDSGPVVYDCTKCIGCRYCMVACPFGVPKFEWEETLPRIRKCNFCADRQEQGLEPACAAACPTGALTFGRRDELIGEAKARIKADPERYVDHVYGEYEVGGTSWIYLSPVPFEAMGFPALQSGSVTTLSECIATIGTPGVALGATVALGGLYFWQKRREKEPAPVQITIEEPGEPKP